MQKPELRLKSSSRQDRSVTREIYARTTDKGNENRWIYSLLLRYNNMKRKLRSGNQDVESAKVLWAGALGYSNLRMLGAFTALTA